MKDENLPNGYAIRRKLHNARAGILGSWLGKRKPCRNAWRNLHLDDSNDISGLK